MNLTDLTAFKSYKHLQYIDISNNNINSESLQVLSELPFLLLIHADKNNLTSGYLKRMKYLQVIIFNYNSISSLYDIYQPEMSTIEVGYNKIKSIKFENRMPSIKCLDFRYNLVDDISDIDFPNLDSLYLAGNKITSLMGIERLKNLRILHVRNNPIKLLNGFDPEHKKLQYINLRNCKVFTLKQVKKLRVSFRCLLWWSRTEYFQFKYRLGLTYSTSLLLTIWFEILHIISNLLIIINKFIIVLYI